MADLAVECLSRGLLLISIFVGRSSYHYYVGVGSCILYHVSIRHLYVYIHAECLRRIAECVGWPPKRRELGGTVYALIIEWELRRRV